MKAQPRFIFLLLSLGLFASVSLNAQNLISSIDTIRWDDLQYFRLFKFKPVNGLDPAQVREVDTVNFEELDVAKAKSFLGASFPVHKNAYKFSPLATYALLGFKDGTVRRLKFTDDGLWDKTTDIYYDVPRDMAEQWKKFTEDSRTVTFKFGDTDK
jgi:hypothetical protein